MTQANRNRRRKLESKLQKMTPEEINIIVNQYIKTLHNLGFWGRLLFAFNIVRKAKGKSKKEIAVHK